MSPANMGDSRFDIRAYKELLRRRYKAVRRNITPKIRAEKDASITANIINMPEFQRAKTLLTYVSTADEVDTHALIVQAIGLGKAVAVPYCVKGTRQMHFYLINSVDELKPRTFGVLEPDPEKCERLIDFNNSVCVLPGLSFDSYGYRLGYGGGYYDRFLSQDYTGITIGIYYWACACPRLIHGRYDQPCDYLVNERQVAAAKRAPR